MNIIPCRRRFPLLALALILALGIFLRFYRLEAVGDGNPYYAATVKSMLTSWHNFFFASFEPGGSVSVDKPPVGFWAQAASAYIFGFNGFALAFPNALGGVVSIFLLYRLVRRPFGEWAGLLAALALAITPAAISAERNNTIDGLLVCVLLGAAWAFLRSVRSGQLRYLLLGAALVGLGFNIKMLQAFLPLPAFYALTFFGSRHPWGKRILHLGIATLLLVTVSFSWAVAVDLVPASERPYIGSSSDNTVMDLIFGHNGLSRLINTGMGRLRDNPGKPFPQPALPSNAIPNAPQAPVPAAPVMDSGTPGPLRLFREPLAGEASWLLPFALAGIILLLLVLRGKPLTDRHLSLLLWAGWLLPEALYFTFSQGLMHAYYMLMLGPPIAALTGMTAWALAQVIQRKALPGLALAVLLTAGTLAFQFYAMGQRVKVSPWMLALVLCLLAAASVCGLVFRQRDRSTRLCLSLLVGSALLAPLTWSLYTTFNPHPDGHLPYSGPSKRTIPFLQPDRPAQPLVDYLLANTTPDQYLVATFTANQAAPFILATGRPVLTFGGFTGSDNIIDPAELAALVAGGRLRFVLDQGANLGKEQILSWLAANCRPVDTRQLVPAAPDPQPPVVRLYDCKK
jgi:4-amino-4-deoxy-L-arabinose transferase-like glycosyltransferase